MKTNLLSIIVFCLSADGIAACPEIPPEPESSKMRAVDYRNALNKIVAAVECHNKEMKEARNFAIQAFRQEVLVKGEKKKGEEQRILADNIAKLTAIKSITGTYIQELDKVVLEYQDLLTDFKLEYLPTILTSNQELTRIALAARGATISKISELYQDLVRLQESEVSRASLFIMKGRRLIQTFLYIDEVYEEKLTPYRDYMKENAFQKPDNASEPMAALRNLVAACEKRSLAYIKKVNDLSASLVRREEALISIQVDKRTSSTIAQSDRLEASANFLQKLNEATSFLMRPEKRDLKYDLPFLEETYLHRKRFLAYLDLCSQADDVRPKWMFTGCKTIEPDLVRAKQYVESLVVKRVRSALRELKREGVINSRMQKIEDHLISGNTLDAIREHDRLLESIQDQK